MGELPLPPLGLDRNELEQRFDALQERLVPLWRSIRELTGDEQTIVVLPSLTVDFPLEGALLQAYEERFLFLLLLLRQPRARLVYVTSQEVHPSLVDYYLGLLPGVITSHARERLCFVSPHDGTRESLTAKLLKRPALLDRIGRMVGDRERAHLVPFITTELERELALRLGIPIFGADPKHQRFGTKSGCRELFAACGISHPLGFENLRTRDDVVRALCELKRAQPECTAAMVKHDDGVSGAGNACVDMRGVDADDAASAERAIDGMILEDKNLDLAGYFAKLVAGGIVEERVSGDEVRSPSVQMRVTPEREVQLISTHDQLLAGPSGQKFAGCLFPADERYAITIASQAVCVGQRLADAGVLGRFAIDYVVVRRGEDWDVYAIELNLRKGGTTHPYLTLQFLTDGHYDASRGRYFAANGEEKCFVASDCVSSDEFRVFSADDVFDIAMRHGLHFDQSRQKGVVFHMLSALGNHGRLGMTAVGASHEEAASLYQRTLDVLASEAAAALAPRPLDSW